MLKIIRQAYQKPNNFKKDHPSTLESRKYSQTTGWFCEGANYEVRWRASPGDNYWADSREW